MSASRSGESSGGSRQKRVGDAIRQDTRNRLLQAARDEFPVRGYAGTTVSRLAAAAGVSVQTLYLAWGSKRALLRGYMENALAGGAGSPEDAGRRFAGLPPRERLAELASLVTEIAERAATGWSLYRDASAVDAEIAADWSELQLLRHRLISRVLDDIPPSAMAAGLTKKSAADTAWTIASPESYDLLVHRLGYQLDEFRHWTERTLIAAILTA
ncbi:MAG TPA: helix-turn-helix domain-containing protein [Streptosporangiaceae bacterium]|nr:helix-turn-helix domain-containing protein [Streptosporangiaceae bacterium]